MSYKAASNQKYSENIIYLEWQNIKNYIFLKFKTDDRQTLQDVETSWNFVPDV